MSKSFTKSGDSFIKKEINVNPITIGVFTCGQSNGAGSTAIAGTNKAEFSGQIRKYDTVLSNGPYVDQIEHLNHTINSSMMNCIVEKHWEDYGDNQYRFLTHNHAVGGRGYDDIKKGGGEALAYAKFTTDLPNIVADYPLEIRCFNLVHGEADLVNPWETYRDNLITFLDDYTQDVKAVTGQSYDPIMIVSQISSQKVYQSVLDNIKSPIALLDVCRISDKHFSCGPQYWIETNGGADQYHLNGRDQIISGEYRAEVYRQVVDKNDRITPTATSPISATLGSDYIDVKFEMNKAPLQFDTDYIPAIADQGFVYSDDNSNTITSVSILGSGDTVRVQLSGSVGNNPDLQYAWHNGNVGSNGVVSGGPRGTICDSNDHASKYYPSYKMRRYALAFRYAQGYLSFS